MGTLQTIFGTDDAAAKTIRLRSLRPVYERQVIREGAPSYLTSTRFNSPSQVHEVFSDLENETKEHFIALHLDGKNRVICFDRISVGSLNQSIVHPREVFKGAMLSSAAALILIHNHPTGDTTPSREDLEITKRLVAAGELVGIRVLDHIIIGASSYLSFVEKGLM